MTNSLILNLIRACSAAAMLLLVPAAGHARGDGAGDQTEMSSES